MVICSLPHCVSFLDNLDNYKKILNNYPVAILGEWVIRRAVLAGRGSGTKDPLGN